MKKKDLLQIIKNGETQEVEFKQSFHSSQGFSKLISAFSNTKGGIIFIGVSPKRRVVGIKEDVDVLQQKIVASSQAISPPVHVDVEVHKHEKKTFVTVVVQKATDNVVHTFQGVIFAKLGSTVKRFEGNQLVDFLRSKQIICFDEIICDARLKDLDSKKITGYLAARNKQSYLQHHSAQDLLLNLKLATKQRRLKIKNAAVLFFAKDPHHFFPQVEINLAQFDGVNPVHVLAHQLIQEGPLQSIDKALLFVKKNISKRIIITDAARRQEHYEYPLEVVREAIINAIAHRDYFSKNAIQIYIFSNRIEITNPGSLPNDLPKELFGSLSMRRNPLTYQLLRDHGYIEGLGSGIPRMIMGMKKHGLKAPEFGIYENFFRIVLYNEKQTSKYADLNTRQIKSIRYLKEHESMKTKDYEDINAVSFGTAIADINELISLKHIRKIGSYKGAYYVLEEEEKYK